MLLLPLSFLPLLLLLFDAKALNPFAAAFVPSDVAAKPLARSDITSGAATPMSVNGSVVFVGCGASGQTASLLAAELELDAARATIAALQLQVEAQEEQIVSLQEHLWCIQMNESMAANAAEDSHRRALDAEYQLAAIVKYSTAEDPAKRRWRNRR